MKISLDGGALCTKPNKRFGNYIFTKNLILALSKFAPNNQYYIHSFCQKPEFVKKTNNIVYKNLQPRIFWSKLRVSLEELLEKNDYFLAINQSLPLLTRAKIISFSHGLSFYFFPKLYPDSFRQLNTQLDQMIARSEKIIVSSQKVKEEIQSIKRFDDNKIVVIPYGVPFDMIKNSKVKTQKLKNKKYFLFVGMNHPIKNIEFLKKAVRYFPGYKLYLAQNCSRGKLKRLYQRATALLTASFYESFNLPVLEALSQGCPVVGLKSAIIPELKKYVFVAENFNQFIDTIGKIIKNNVNTEINVEKLKKEFSWEKYINKLLHYINIM